MLRLNCVVACLVAASFLASCSGNTAQAPMPNLAQQMPLHSQLPKFLRLGQTPAHPPPRTHRITAAMRARAKKGGWQELSAASPFVAGADSEIQMTDGTVLVRDYCTANWFRLTPDKSGNYQDGTWSSVAALPSGYEPLYFASAILPDGKLIMNGGEYNNCVGDETNLGAIYDPVANSWTAVSAPSGWSQIGDGQSAVLANGTYMIGNCCTYDQALYNEKSSTWTQIGGTAGGKNDANSEEGWTLLRDGNLIVADVSKAPDAELYVAAKQDWISAGQTPVNLTSEYEIGPQTMMPNDIVFVVGANGYTALYSGKSGKWSAGPMMPKSTAGAQLDIADGPSTVLTDGSVIAAASPGVYGTPATFVHYDGGKTIKVMATPADAMDDSSYNIRLLILPNGQVLETDDSSDVEIYTAKAPIYPGIAPKISSVGSTLTSGSTYTIKGTNFNGFTQANFYGDDDQQATNYPLVRITNASSGTVVYARTFDFSTMAIGAKGTESASFQVPSSIGSGASTVEVVTNGISSKPVNVTIQAAK
jgi:hypothetical protein